MNLNELRTRIENKTAKLAVIGQGYLGLPVAALFAGKNFTVFKFIRSYDAAIVMIAHSGYKELDFHKLKSVLRLPVLLDGRQVLDEQVVGRHGFAYRRVGSAG